MVYLSQNIFFILFLNKIVFLAYRYLKIWGLIFALTIVYREFSRIMIELYPCINYMQKICISNLKFVKEVYLKKNY